MTALTHLATVNTSAGPRRAYIKAYMPSAPRGLLNEIVGYTLAHHAKLPQPTGALISLPASILAAVFPKAALPPVLTCFVSIDAEDILRRKAGTAKAFFGCNLKAIAASLKNWDAYALMVAFDEWVANVDRNTGNLLLTGPDEYWVIDHGNVLTGPSWIMDDMNPHQWSMNKMLDLVFSPSALPLPIKNAILKSAAEFLSIYGRAAPELRQWLSGNSCSGKLQAHHFIWHRAETTPQLLRERLLLVI